MIEIWKYEKALQYEIFVKEEYQQAKEIIKHANLIFDIGSHIGLFSEWCLSLNPQVEIFAFEPMPLLFETMEERLSSYQNQIHFFNYGISSKTERIPFFFNSQKTMQSSKFSSFLNPQGEKIEVNMISFSQILEEYQISQIDLIKMDIEGMEFEVLESRKESLFEHINAMIIEIHCFDTEKEEKSEWLQQWLPHFFSKVLFTPNEYDKRIGLLFCEK